MIGLIVLAVVAAFAFYAGRCNGYNRAVDQYEAWAAQNKMSPKPMVSAVPAPAPVPAPVSASADTTPAPVPVEATPAPAPAVVAIAEPRSVVELCRAHDERIRSGFAQVAASEVAAKAAAEAAAAAKKDLARRKRLARSAARTELSLEDEIAALQDHLQQERMEAQLH